MQRLFYTLLVNLLLSINTLVAQNEKPKVYLFLYEDCPISIYMTPYIKEIQKLYANKVVFNFVYPNAMSNYKTIAEFNKKYNLTGGEIHLDENHTVTDELGATITPEAILTVHDTIIFKGRINDGYAQLGKRRSKPRLHDLQNAIDYMLTSQDPKPLENCPPAIGCYISK